MPNEQSVKIGSLFRDLGSLSTAIREGVTQRVLARAADRLEKGQEIAFGKLKVSKVGLSDGRERLTWGQVAGIGLSHNGTAYSIVIRKQGKRLAWYSRLFVQFPNADAFMRLAGQFTKVSEAE